MFNADMLELIQELLDNNYKITFSKENDDYKITVNIDSFDYELKMVNDNIQIFNDYDETIIVSNVKEIEQFKRDFG